MLKISFDNRICGRKRRLFSITNSIDKDRAQLAVALRHSTGPIPTIYSLVPWQFTVLASSERATNFYDAYSLSSSRLTRGRNDRADVDCSIKVTSAVRKCPARSRYDAEIRGSLSCAWREKVDARKRSRIMVESDFTYKERVVQVRSHTCVCVCTRATCQRNDPSLTPWLLREYRENVYT